MISILTISYILQALALCVAIFLVFFNDTIRLGKTDKEWDRLINEAMDNDAIPKYKTHVYGTHSWETKYCVNMGGIEFWNANYPYAYGRPDDETEFSKPSYRLPSRKTQKRLKYYCEAFGISIVK